MKYSSIALFFLPAILVIFQNQVNAAPSPASALDIGDIPTAILNLLLSPGIQVSQLNIKLSVLSLLVQKATLNFDAVSPLPLVELTIDGMSAQIGKEGSTIFSFNQTFTNFILPGLSTVNSGTVSNVDLPEGGLAAFNVLQETRFDIISATYNMRVLTVNGTAGIPLSLPALQLNVPTDVTFGLL